MVAYLLLTAALVRNYIQHRRHRPTMCSLLRHIAPWPVALCLWLALTSWILPHLRNGYPKEH